MEKIKTTLHPKDSPNDELYPNVLPSNIPVDSTLDNTGDTLKVNTDTLQGKLTSGDGISISDNTIAVADTITKEKTFNNGVKTNKITNTNGYKIIDDDGSHINLGNSSRIIQIQGSSSRPTYNGEDIALLTDSDTLLKTLLWANLGIGRWSSQNLYSNIYTSDEDYFIDNFSTYYTNLTRWANNVTYNVRLNHKIILPNFNTEKSITADYMLYNFTTTTNTNCELVFSNCNISGQYLLSNSNIAKISVTDNCTALLKGSNMFNNMPNLTEINGIDFSNVNEIFAWNRPIFNEVPKLTTIKVKNIKGNVDFSKCAAITTTEQLQNIFDSCLNLKSLGISNKTLRFNATQFKAITTEQSDTMVNVKGWTLTQA